MVKRVFVVCGVIIILIVIFIIIVIVIVIVFIITCGGGGVFVFLWCDGICGVVFLLIFFAGR